MALSVFTLMLSNFTRNLMSCANGFHIIYPSPAYTFPFLVIVLVWSLNSPIARSVFFKSSSLPAKGVLLARRFTPTQVPGGKLLGGLLLAFFIGDKLIPVVVKLVSVRVPKAAATWLGVNCNGKPGVKVIGCCGV